MTALLAVLAIAPALLVAQSGDSAADSLPRDPTDTAIVGWQGGIRPACSSRLSDARLDERLEREWERMVTYYAFPREH